MPCGSHTDDIQINTDLQLEDVLQQIREHGITGYEQHKKPNQGNGYTELVVNNYCSEYKKGCKKIYQTK